MSKKEAIAALLQKLAGDDADIPAFGSTADAIAFLADCLSVTDGAVGFEVPSKD